MGSNYYEHRGRYSDRQLVDCYLKYHSTIKASKELGCSFETVARAVRRAAIPLDGRKVNISGSPTKISDEQILQEIAQGLTRQEIASKYDVHVENLARRMRNLGVHATYAKPIAKSRAASRAAVVDHWHYSKGVDDLVAKRYGESFEFVSYKRRRARIRCKICGSVLERNVTTLRKYKTRCSVCEEQKKKIAEARIQFIGVLNSILLAKTPRICEHCGKEYYSQKLDQKYCSTACKHKAKVRRKGHSRVRQRCRHYGVSYEPGITLEKVYERDGGVCKICGKPTDWTDRSWSEHFGPLYPTIDHIVALANGGCHTWGNVQLAHAICNSYKRDLVV